MVWECGASSERAPGRDIGTDLERRVDFLMRHGVAAWF